ncbi:conserved hypothetical protein [Trichinella spiralis]|uniref:hypothetical protein n=1 Tax=Trichinella spiralis TaxID=6334 RepID=UPI0001EFE498|nr:conserved hypothetical protein [Trichinella spiralis]
MVSGRPRRATNRRKARRKLSIVWSGTSSKCMARITIHVNRKIRGPTKSIPTLLNGLAGFTLIAGRSPIRCQNGRAASRWQIPHVRITRLTALRPRRIQNLSLNAVRV